MPDHQPDPTLFQFDTPRPIRGFPTLHWQGKRPFTGTQYYPAQLKETHGRPVEGWLNEIYWGDNLQVMSHLLKKYRGQVKLVYIDPPFDSKADYKKKIETKGKAITNDQNSFEEKQYTDIWTNDEYLQFLYERVILTRELLCNDGLIYIHCDWHKNHYIRSICEEIFGAGNFVNEIIWYYYNKMQGNINRFASNHDTILVYRKGGEFTFNKIYEKRDSPVQQIKRAWDKETKKLVNAKDENGNILYIESKFRTVDDVWRLSMLQPADNTENLRYPTQKPETILERIILAASNPGDLVFDCFMGSGTTQAVAMKLGRRFIGADINLGAVQTTTKRLLGVAADLREKQNKAAKTAALPKQMELAVAAEPDVEYSDGSNGSAKEDISTWYTGFSVFNVNHYDVFRNPLEARDLLLAALEVQPYPAGSLYDGEKDGRQVKIMPVNRIATRVDLNALITGFNLREFEERSAKHPGRPVESITLVCMGHEPDLAATLKEQVPYKLDVEVVDILRDKANLEFKRDAEAEVVIENGRVVIRQFYPMNLLQKLSLMRENVEDWRELVESVMIDFNYDGAVLEPSVVDIPEGRGLVSGAYPVPEGTGAIRVKITDLLSESLETTVKS